MTTSIDLFNQIADRLGTTQHVVSGKMFGVLCLKTNGKAFAAFFQEEMVFKLAGESRSDALSLSGAKLFDPSEKKRPMKEWVQVPVIHSEKWHHFSEEALRYVQSSK